MSLIAIIICVIVLIIVLSCINVVPQAKAYVVERLGGYQATWVLVYILNFRSSTV